MKIPQPQEEAEDSHEDGKLTSVKALVPFPIVLMTPAAQTTDASNPSLWGLGCGVHASLN